MLPHLDKKTAKLVTEAAASDGLVAKDITIVPDGHCAIEAIKIYRPAAVTVLVMLTCNILTMRIEHAIDFAD